MRSCKPPPDSPPLVPPESEAVKTHLEDLQAEIEAGARKLDVLSENMAEMRTAILHRQLHQAALAGALVRRVRDVQECVRRQREQLRELRHAIRERRAQRTR